MNKQLLDEFDSMDIVPYTRVDKYVSWAILAVVVINLVFVAIAIVWGN